MTLSNQDNGFTGEYTSAAPTYFPSFDGYVDGGVFANSPAMCALADAYKMFRGSELPFLVVSIGTGDDVLRYVYRDVKWRGILRWAIPILKIVFDGVSDTVDYQAAEMADQYYRFQEEGVAAELDDASPDTIQRLLAAADELISRNDETLTALATLLKENVSHIPPTAARERPGRPPRNHHPLGQMRRQRLTVFVQQAFGRRDSRKLIGDLFPRHGGRDESARRKLDPRQPRGIARRHRREVVALARVQERVVDDRARRDDARHLAADQADCLLRVLDLLAHGDAHPQGDQLGEITLQLMVRKARHRDRVLALFAAGQGEIHQACGRLRVVVEELVEIAHAKQQQCLGARLLGFQVLLHHGRDGVRHSVMLTDRPAIAEGAGERWRMNDEG